MTDVFISYSRSIEPQAQRIAEMLTPLGYSVWRDDQLPAHRAYTDVTEERLREAKAVLVIWSAEAVKSQWVRAEAEVARVAGTLVQVSLDGSLPPLPFTQIQCADMSGWIGEADTAGWRKVVASIAELVGGERQAHAGPVAAAPIDQEIHFCKAADGVRIAYATVGHGPPLLKTANWLNHLEYDWGSPVWDELFRRMAAGHTLYRYDERGSGLSDWNADELSLEAYVQDMEAVVSAAGLERFSIFAISQGGCVSIEYAARHPDQVTRLILLNAFARGWRQTSSKAFITKVEAIKVLMAAGWAGESSAFRQIFTALLLPGANPKQRDWFDAMQRASTSAQNAARLLESFGTMDVRHRLAEVKAPTLVLHSRDDLFIPPRLGQEIAAGIAGARFVGLPTNNHILLAGEPAFVRLASEIDAFLAEDT